MQVHPPIWATVFSHAGSWILLVVVILALYLFLNWITKGYFSTRLKIAMFAVLVIIGILLFLGMFWAGQPVYTQH